MAIVTQKNSIFGEIGRLRRPISDRTSHSPLFSPLFLRLDVPHPRDICFEIGRLHKGDILFEIWHWSTDEKKCTEDKIWECLLIVDLSKRRRTSKDKIEARVTVEFFYRHTWGGWLNKRRRKVLLFLIKTFCIVDPFPGTNFRQLWPKYFLWWEILNRDVSRIVEEMAYRKAQRQFSQISGWISVGRKIICLESYVPMSSKTQSKQRGKIQPLKTVELSEYQQKKFKFTCTNPRIVSAKKDVVETFTLDPLDYTLSLAHWFIFIISGFPIFNRYGCAQILM